MEPLASLNGVGSSPSPALAVRERDPAAFTVRAPDEPRPVTLVPDRLDPPESYSPKRHQPRANDDDDPPRFPGFRPLGAQVHSEAPLHPSVVDVPNGRSVRFRTWPDAADRIQTTVVDRETEETIRAIPTDEHLKTSQQLRQYLGQRIDILA